MFRLDYGYRAFVIDGAMADIMTESLASAPIAIYMGDCMIVFIREDGPSALLAEAERLLESTKT